MLDDIFQPFSDDYIDRGIQSKSRRKRDAQIRRAERIAFNRGRVRIAQVETRHRLEGEGGIRDVTSDGRNHRQAEAWLGKARSIWNGAVRWFEADNADMGWRAPTGAAGIGPDRKRHKVCRDSRCGPTRRATR